MKRKALIVILVLSLVLPALALSVSDEHTAASAGDQELAPPDSIQVTPSRTDISMKAGESTTVDLVITNSFTRNLVVSVNPDSSDSDVSISFPEKNTFVVEWGDVDPVIFTVNISIWKYARTTEHTISFDIEIIDTARGKPLRATASDMFNISVTSDLSAGKSYNKIMGVVDNNLPAPFNGSWFSAIVSLAIWVLIAGTVAYIAVPLVQQAIADAKKEEKKIEERLER